MYRRKQRKFVTTSKKRMETGLEKRESDFIFYDPAHLELERISNFPVNIFSDDMTEGLPNKFYPSDHVSLYAEFRFIK